MKKIFKNLANKFSNKTMIEKVATHNAKDLKIENKNKKNKSRFLKTNIKQNKLDDKNIAKIKYSLIPISTGSDLTQRKIPLMEVKSKNDGPTIWFTACIHGDEVGGMVVVQEVFNFIKKYGLVKGKVKAIPLVNPMGFEYLSRTIPSTERVPSTEEDINRVFPGDKNGSLADRIAYKIFNLIKSDNPDLVIDLHNDWTDSVPYVILDTEEISDKKTFDKSVYFAKKTGFVSLIDEALIGSGKQTTSDDLKKTLTGSTVNIRIPSITMELGPDQRVHERFVKLGVSAIINIMVEMGMIKISDFKEFKFEIPNEIENQILNYDYTCQASKSGVIRYVAKPGQYIKKGELLCRIYNPFGRLEETVIAKKDVYILGHNDISIANPGTALYALAYVNE
jgi:predicted deacylase